MWCQFSTYIRNLFVPQRMPQRGALVQNSLPIIFSVSALYFLLVLFLWAPFGLANGMPYETTFVYFSETHPLIKGFFYKGDRLRIHMSFFYHLSYLLAEVLRIGGSFLTYQIVYALLWWARGVLMFLILRKLIPKYALFNYLVGALVILHASDHALNWVGQLNQFGMIFWMLLSFYMLVSSLKEEVPRRTLFYVVLSLIFAYMSLWSYESQLLIIFLFPALLLTSYFGFAKRNVLIICIYYIVPATYGYLNLVRYFGPHAGGTYQESVLREDLGIYPMLSDLAFNIVASLKFWNWAAALPGNYPQDQFISIMFPSAAAIVFIGGAFILSKMFWKSSGENAFPSARYLSIILVAGLILLISSFPAYLILNSARSLWRTQFLSGIGAALVMGSLISLVHAPFRNAFRFMALLFVGATISFFGTSAALKAAAFHYDIWERHRQAIAQVLHVAPNVNPGTVVVLVNVPKDSDPFVDNMWFDVALRLAYPGTLVSGIYFYEDGIPAPGRSLELRSGKWESPKRGFRPLVREAELSQTVVIQYDKHGEARLVKDVPKFLGVRQDLLQRYNPWAVIKDGPPSPRALRRYGDPKIRFVSEAVLSGTTRKNDPGR